MGACAHALRLSCVYKGRRFSRKHWTSGDASQPGYPCCRRARSGQSSPADLILARSPARSRALLTTRQFRKAVSRNRSQLSPLRADRVGCPVWSRREESGLTFQQHCAVHSSIRNHFNQERGHDSRDNLRAYPTAALAEWRHLCAAQRQEGFGKQRAVRNCLTAPPETRGFPIQCNAMT